MQQPSAQGIAALFRGNPAPLQQRIQMEQQGKPGLPPDLQKLLALNIVTNEKDAVAKQQAMNQLAQMQGPQGKPPTVMESVQEQARQKMQAQQVQAQRQQQAMQAMMQQAGPGPVPEGTPQPQAQPQGIDELPVEFSMAEGGIIAFEKGGRGEYETPYDRMNRENRERAEEEERARLENIREMGNETMPYGEQMRNLGRAIDKAVPDPVELIKTLISAPGYGLSKDEAPSQAATRSAAPIATSQRPGDVFVPRRKPEAPIADLKSLAEKERRQPRPTPVAAAPAPQSAGIAAALPAAESQAARMMQERMERDPNAVAANREMMYQSRVGAPDTTQRDAAIRALEEDRRRYAEPEGGFAGLMEYLGQIAATPRGMSSFEAGAAGARGVQAAQKQRADQRMAIGMKIIEQEQGKIDASRQYAKDVFGVGDAAYNQAYKEQFDAAKQITSNEMDAKKLAQEMTLKQMDIEQRKAEEKGRMARDRVPLDQQVFPGYLKQAGGDVAKAYEMMKAAGVSSVAKPMTRDQASDNVAKKLEITNPNRKQVVSDATQALRAAGIANPSFAQIEEHLIQEQMKGVSLAGPSGPTAQQTGKVPPPPPGFKMN